MKNVIVFAAGSGRYAIELRWVREVLTLGYVTRVPTAPAGFGGVVNVRGAVVAVLDVATLIGRDAPRRARPGDGAILVDVDSVRAAIRVDTIGEVSTLTPTEGAALVDSRGNQVTLLDPPEVVEWALAAVGAGLDVGGPGLREE